ncbi:hypothetical protein JTY60_01860 [symbiont of Argiope bruennichi]|uniref:hypothetical protein n=1 Tax=symbiont of Argiope bruennichi TaxID=2810479 RepID=UPI003DA46F6F
MKIEKKIKTFLLASLTIFASTISVVGCEKEKNEENQNYRNFVSKLSNIDPNYDNQFLKYTNLKLFTGETEIEDSGLNFSVNSFNISNIKLIGLKKDEVNKVVPTSLTNLKNQKIKIDKDNKNILFKLDYGTFDLNNIIFISNFNLKISKNDNESMVFNNITVFFQLSPNFSCPKKSDYNLDLYDCSNISNLINYGISPEQSQKMTFTFDNEDDMNKPDIGYNPKVSKNSILTGDLIDEDLYYDINWHPHKFKIIEMPLLFNMDLNKQITIDGTNHEFIIECNKIVRQINIEGVALDKEYSENEELYASFFSEFDVKNPEPASFKKGNFIIVFKHD